MESCTVSELSRFRKYNYSIDALSRMSLHLKLCLNVLINPLTGEWCLFKCAILVVHL